MTNKGLNDLRRLLNEIADKYDARRVGVEIDLNVGAMLLTIDFSDFYRLRKAVSFNDLTLLNIDIIGEFEREIEEHLRLIKAQKKSGAVDNA